MVPLQGRYGLGPDTEEVDLSPDFFAPLSICVRRKGKRRIGLGRLYSGGIGHEIAPCHLLGVLNKSRLPGMPVVVKVVVSDFSS